MSTLLEARELVVSFGGLVALDGVSLSVAERTVVGLMGPNGAGKTTCFGVLSGLLRPRDGQVVFDGVDVTRWSPPRRAHAGLARTFQRLELFGELTVREHLVVAYRARRRARLRDRAWRLPLDLLGLGARPDPGEVETVDGILELLGLTRVAHWPASSLPLGTGRQVEIARALATRPRVLLLDEPSSGLDARETAELAAVLARLPAEHGAAVVLVEHDVEMVLGVAHEVTVLDFGRVIARGAPAEVRADPAVQAAYLGTAT
jgi:ABC-type branched-subunit amino acid transport system ATPase component